MNRVISLFVATVLLGNLAVAQSVDDGKKFLYYERYNSAKQTFQQILAAKPDNAEAIYWLGQTLIATKDSTEAKQLYQQALAAKGNDPMLLVGMGQILLMEGKKDEARQQFETAISLTKAKDVNVLNAVGEANVRARPGDAAYAVEKLKQATETRRFKNPYTYLIMGDAYRKLIDGGNAVTAYNKALELEPNLAAAKNKIGKIYETQDNPDYFLPAYEDATLLDTAYAPAYFNLFYYYYFRDVNKAAVYLDKYLANTDQGPDMEYVKTDFTYAKGDFAGANTRAKELIAQFGDKVNPRMYRMVAYTSDTLGRIDEAKQAMLTFLEKADPEEILATDYEELAKINSKIPGMEEEVVKNYELAIQKDTVVANKLKFIQSAAALAKSSGNLLQQAEWFGKAYALEKEPSQRDLYNWAYAYYQAGAYRQSDSLFCDVYVSQYPEEIYGYLWCARAKQAQDTTMEQGLAVDAYKQLAEKAVTLDTTADKQLKPYAINANFYLVSYYNDIAREKDTAIFYTDKVLEIDPTNENAIRVKEILTAPPPKSSAQPRGTSRN